MFSLLVTSGYNQNEINSWLLISRPPYLFVWLVMGSSCEDWAQTYHEYLLVKKKKKKNEILDVSA